MRTGKTTVEGIFASGDVVLGAKTVVQAVAYSKKVAEAMDAYMKSKDEKKEKRKRSEGFHRIIDKDERGRSTGGGAPAFCFKGRKCPC